MRLEDSLSLLLIAVIAIALGAMLWGRRGGDDR